ncbi:PREDICTED: trypsin-7-like [Habropoda laboriosa]|nr:PREDICTED: trypsin-7-like [Habropoda laboriosa]
MTTMILILLAALATANAASLTLDLDPRIVNGENVKAGEIPYQVSLQTQGRHFCGGSVLNANYVLTAAHCVENQKAENIDVIAGTINLQSRPSVHKAEKIVKHEKYNPSNNWINDIALIKVKTPFVPSSQISFVPLPRLNEAVSANSVAVVSGWGRLRSGGPTTNQLQKARIYITDQNVCKKAYGNIFDTQICANYPSNEKGACQGDSGGPLTVNGKIVGIVSWSRGCGLPNYPTVYTRVPSYVSWIQQHAV